VDLFPFMYICFLFSIADNTFTGFDYMRNTAVSYKKRELLTFLSIWVLTCLCFVRYVLLIFSVFCVVFYCFVCSRSLTCGQCCQFHWIVHSWLPFWFSLAFIESKTTPSYSRFTLFWRYVQTLDGFHCISPLNLDISISWKQ